MGGGGWEDFGDGDVGGGDDDDYDDCFDCDIDGGNADYDSVDDDDVDVGDGYGDTLCESPSAAPCLRAIGRLLGAEAQRQGGPREARRRAATTG